MMDYILLWLAAAAWITFLIDYIFVHDFVSIYEQMIGIAVVLTFMGIAIHICFWYED